jgi:putative DNA primase/helicase
MEARMQPFADFARDHGLLINQVIDDGRVHRCATEEHPRARNGAYRIDGDWGWVQDWAIHMEPIIWRATGSHADMPITPRRDIEADRREDEARKDQAAALASTIVNRCSTGPHPYLARKGFPDEIGLIDTDGRLVVPMRDMRAYKRINSVQWIDDTGTKRFLPGGAAKGSVLMLGVGQEHWLCEGYATALSIRAALGQLHRQARVVVCFSAGNLVHVASQMPGRKYLVADNDKSGTGERSAIATGLPWSMPPAVGMDANDYHQAAGIRALAELMRKVVTSA